MGKKHCKKASSPVPNNEQQQLEDVLMRATCTSGVFGGGWIVLYVLTTTWVRFLIETIAHSNQRKLLQQMSTIPPQLKQYYSDDMFLKMRIKCVVNSYKYSNRQLYKAILTTINFQLKLFCRAWALSGMINEYEYIRIVTFNSAVAIIQLTIIQFLEGLVAVFLALRNQSVVMNPVTSRSILEKIYMWMIAVITTQFTWQWWSGTLFSVLITFLAHRGPHFPVFCYLLYRIYRDYLKPNVLHPFSSSYHHLPKGELDDRLQALSERLHFPLDNIYIDRGEDPRYHGARVRGVGERNNLIISWRLAEGHDPDASPIVRGPWPWSRSTPPYTVDEIVAVCARAMIKWRVADTADEVILEASRWPRLIAFTMTTTVFKPLYQLFGFLEDRPAYIGFILSTYLAQPVIFVASYIRHQVYQQRCYLYDEIIDRIGMGVPLISYLCKECVANGRCPVEDPLYSKLYSTNPPLMDRISRMEMGSGL